MIEVACKHAGEYPVLELNDSNLRDESLPLAFFYHGWEGCKEKVLTQGYEIAKRGFRVVIPDAQYHGERMVGGPAKTHFLEFWQIIADSVAEFPKIVDYYEETTGIKDDFVGVSGLSMGGITTCALMASYDWISSAVCLMGSPCPVEFAKKLIASMRRSKTFRSNTLIRSFRLCARLICRLRLKRLPHARSILARNGRSDSTV